ncbi:MAG: tRNA lysidine(34) synthetase TilS [Mycoplasmatales bacterium]
MTKTFNINKKYLLACSGGVDSCVLFDILIQKNCNFIVVHFNHNTRGDDNKLDLGLVKMMCENNNIDFLTYEYLHEKGNFQANARKFRINTYKKIIKKFNLSGVILAHHGDDQIENILMNDIKIGKVLMKDISIIDNISIYRPLLGIYKDDLYKYAIDNEIKYNEDVSNGDKKYKRNYYRSLNKLSKKEKDLTIKLQTEREKYYDQISYNLGNFIEKEYYESFGDHFLLLYLFLKNKINDNISIKLLETIVNTIDFKGTKEIQLPNNYIFIQEYNELKIIKKSVKAFKKHAPLKLGINEFNGVVFKNTLKNGSIRTRKDGDKIKFDYGSKKVTRVMIDIKIKKNMRNHWPIVVNEEDMVLYIPKDSKK